MDVYAEYKSNLRSPEEAVRLVKSGDWVDYASNIGFPVLLDGALARRRDELKGVKIRGNLLPAPSRPPSATRRWSTLCIRPGTAPAMSAGSATRAGPSSRPCSSGTWPGTTKTF